MLAPARRARDAGPRFVTARGRRGFGRKAPATLPTGAVRRIAVEGAFSRTCKPPAPVQPGVPSECAAGIDGRPLPQSIDSLRLETRQPVLAPAAWRPLTRTMFAVRFGDSQGART